MGFEVVRFDGDDAVWKRGDTVLLVRTGHPGRSVPPGTLAEIRRRVRRGGDGRER